MVGRTPTAYRAEKLHLLFDYVGIVCELQSIGFRSGDPLHLLSLGLSVFPL